MTKDQLRAQAGDRLRAASANLSSLEKQAAEQNSWPVSEVIALTALQISYARGCLALADHS